jgi:hypothetical protein
MDIPKHREGQYRRGPFLKCMDGNHLHSLTFFRKAKQKGNATTGAQCSGKLSIAAQVQEILERTYDVQFSSNACGEASQNRKLLKVTQFCDAYLCTCIHSNYVVFVTYKKKFWEELIAYVP